MRNKSHLLTMLKYGYTSSEIADELGVTMRAVQYSKKRMFKDLRCCTDFQAGYEIGRRENGSNKISTIKKTGRKHTNRK